ncbi:amine oxidase [Irpex rosettiformis]|uniref:Amine oxidase n=1 Tax=Irpex rosettiformis TaxID=378272 RepID=A0ACB8U0P6_9APHY|nr:amine oxidase [Irpex rosettiformis]
MPSLGPLALALYLSTSLALPAPPQIPLSSARSDAKVLILGGGMAGITAARTLHDQGIDDFIVVEARHEVGGRMLSHTFGEPGRQYTVELGANWVQGTRHDDGPENPVWTLAKKHHLDTRLSSYFEGLATFDEDGPVNYTDVIEAASRNFDKLIASAGARLPKSLVDASARTGYSLTGSRPQTPHEHAAEYYHFDWEFQSSPEETSWLASSWNNNSTFFTFSEQNAMSVDGRGFKTILQSEARSFLREDQIRLNATVDLISYSDDGVEVRLTDGQTLSADHVICTFSLGVLQHDDVHFEPPLPMWKREAIYSMTMGVYTKIFLQFPYKFWFDTEIALYADRERGRYPIWQSLDDPDFFPGSGILLTTVTNAFSRRIVSLPKDQILDELLDVLGTMYPNITIPAPTDFHFKSWDEDPLFRGSYANWPPSFLEEKHANLRADVKRRVWFAGEAGSKLYFGYLQGAYFEGRHVAMKVTSCVQGSREACVGFEHVKNVKNTRPYDIDYEVSV